MSKDQKTDRPIPLGQRFSQVHVERSQPGMDSPRMRRRLASLISSINELGELGQRAEQELGIAATWSRNQTWIDCCEGWNLNDVLDLITIAFRQLYAFDRDHPYSTNKASQWVVEVNRIFQEENLHYQVDPRGGVHFHPDREFANNVVATVSSLQGARYANTLDAFEAGRTALTGASPDGKAAVRSTFAAAEGLFRLMLPAVPRLTAAEIEKLRPMLQSVYANNPAALGAASKMLKAFQDWVDAAHFYRHEPGTEEVAQPPLGLAIWLTSTGASHLRWLAETDAVIRKS